VTDQSQLDHLAMAVDAYRALGGSLRIRASILRASR